MLFSRVIASLSLVVAAHTYTHTHIHTLSLIQLLTDACILSHTLMYKLTQIQLKHTKQTHIFQCQIREWMGWQGQGKQGKKKETFLLPLFLYMLPAGGVDLIKGVPSRLNIWIKELCVPTAFTASMTYITGVPSMSGL